MKVGWYGVFSFFSAQFCWGQNASMQSNSKGMLCGFSARKIKSWKLLSSLFLDPDSRTSSLLQPSQHHYCRIFKMFTNFIFPFLSSSLLSHKFPHHQNISTLNHFPMIATTLHPPTICDLRFSVGWTGNTRKPKPGNISLGSQCIETSWQSW